MPTIVVCKLKTLRLSPPYLKNICNHCSDRLYIHVISYSNSLIDTISLVSYRTVKHVLRGQLLNKNNVTLSDRWPIKRASIQMKFSMAGQKNVIFKYRWLLNRGGRLGKFDYKWHCCTSKFIVHLMTTM